MLQCKYNFSFARILTKVVICKFCIQKISHSFDTILLFLQDRGLHSKINHTMWNLRSFWVLLQYQATLSSGFNESVNKTESLMYERSLSLLSVNSTRSKKVLRFTDFSFYFFFFKNTNQIKYENMIIAKNYRFKWLL